MDVESQLIEAAERMGYGLDLNHLRGTYTVETHTRKEVFSTMQAALSFIRRRESLMRSLAA